MHFRHIAVIFNPRSGRPRARQASVNRFASLLRESGRAVQVLPTEAPDHASDLARRAVEEGCDLVIAHGGDGTINEVLQGVVGSDATLGLWPGGTANLLAHEINFPSRIPDVVERIIQGRVERVTAGRANGRYFLLMVGVGLDAEVAGSVDPELKRRIGKGAFVVSTLRFVWNWNLEPFRVHFPGGEEMVGRFVVAGNARSYGGGFRLTPRADLTDPHLDLCIFTSEERMDYLKIALASLFASHHAMPGVTYRKVDRCHITSAARTGARIQMDGEVAGRLPLTLEAVPGAVRLLV